MGLSLRRRARQRRAPEEARTSQEVAGEPATPGNGVAVLLRADRETVAFTGRTEELALLRDWYSSDEPRSVRVVVGASGVGKTRLALQVAAQWDAGGALWRPVADGDEAIAVAAARAVSSGRLLLLVDDAETRAGLADLMTGVLSDPGPVRVLLAARSLGEWWDRLAADSAVEARALLGAPPVALDAPLSVGTSDGDVAAAAVPYFARALSAPEPVTIEVERSALRLPVLLLHGASLLAMLGSAADVGRTSRVVIGTGVLRELLGWEARYWRQAAVAAGLPDDEPLIEQAVAAVALTGAGNAAEAQAVLARLPHLSSGAHEDRGRWARWLAGLYPAGPDGRMGTLQPDMLAQTQVAGLLAADSVLARALLRNLPREQAEHALSMLARAGARDRGAREVLDAALHYDLAHLAVPAARVATRGHPDLAEVLCDALCHAPAAPGVLVQIALELPRPSRVLAEADLIATLRAREALPLDAAPEAAAQWDDRAARLLAEPDGIGERPGQDLELWSGATRGANRREQRYRPKLAVSLTRLAVR
ncbi:MAG: hypothetical protein ACRDNF_06625, partial [Streptosporangiaceae bacterium]